MTSLVNFFLNDLVVQDLVAHDKIVSCGRGLKLAEDPNLHGLTLKESNVRLRTKIHSRMDWDCP